MCKETSRPRDKECSASGTQEEENRWNIYKIRGEGGQQQARGISFRVQA